MYDVRPSYQTESYLRKSLLNELEIGALQS